MRRPLLFWCFLTLMIIRLLYSGGWITGVYGPPDGQIITVTGKIYQKNTSSFCLKIHENATQLWLSELSQEYDSISHSQTRKMIKGKLICDYDGADRLELGSVVTLRGTFCAFDRAGNPGEFDYAGYYRSSGFAGRLQEIVITGRTAPPVGWREFLHRLRGWWEERLYRIFPEKEASVMAAVLLGNKADVDSGIKELYRKNGIIHILSISGLHITMIGMGIYRLLRKTGLPVWLAAVGGGALLVLYGCMTGLGISTCRAIGMYLFRMLALLCGRTYDMLTALGVTAVVLVAGNPAYLENMGFLMSFGAVLGVGAVQPVIAPAKDEEHMRKRRYAEGGCRRVAAGIREAVDLGLRQGMLAGCSVTVAILPIQLWFSYEIPTYSVLLNALILPCMSIVLVAGVIAVTIPGMGIVGTADILILTWYEKLCRWMEKLPFPVWNPGRPAVWQIILYYLLWISVISLTVCWRRRKKQSDGRKVAGRRMGDTGVTGAGILRGMRGVWIAKVFALTISVMIVGMTLPGGDRVTFLDVGQGDCICVQLSTGEVYLFDCGSSSRKHIGAKVLIPFLKYYSISKIDAVFLTHADSDHINGILELLQLGREEHITIGQIVLPGMNGQQLREEFGEVLAAVENVSQERAVPVITMEAGDTWQAGKGKKDCFLCLHPETAEAGEPTAGRLPSGGGNEDSLCFYIRLQEGKQSCSFLLTGDVEGAGEQQLLEELRTRGIADVAVLKVAHHGSKGTTAEELLEQTDPVLSVISCGKHNRYGHPHRELLERLERAGTGVIRTDESGAVTVRIWKNGVTVTTFGRGSSSFQSF